MPVERSFGSAPIEDRYKANMNAVARVLDDTFNPDQHGKDREIGFVLLVFPFGTKDGCCNYISNGADRADIVKMLREQANRFDTGAM